MNVAGMPTGVRYATMGRVAAALKDAELVWIVNGMFDAHVKLAGIRDDLRDQYLDVGFAIERMDDAILELAKLGVQ